MNPQLMMLLQQLTGGNPFGNPQALHSLFGGNAFGLHNMGNPAMGQFAGRQGFSQLPSMQEYSIPRPMVMPQGPMLNPFDIQPQPSYGTGPVLQQPPLLQQQPMPPTILTMPDYGSPQFQPVNSPPIVNQQENPFANARPMYNTPNAQGQGLQTPNRPAMRMGRGLY